MVPPPEGADRAWSRFALCVTTNHFYIVGTSKWVCITFVIYKGKVKHILQEHVQVNKGSSSPNDCLLPAKRPWAHTNWASKQPLSPPPVTDGKAEAQRGQVICAGHTARTVLGQNARPGPAQSLLTQALPCRGLLQPGLVLTTFGYKGPSSVQSSYPPSWAVPNAPAGTRLPWSYRGLRARMTGPHSPLPLKPPRCLTVENIQQTHILECSKMHSMYSLIRIIC